MVGEEALQKTLAPIGQKIKDKNDLYLATLGADIVSNAMYYSAIGAGDTKKVWPRAIGLGLLAGIGAVKLTGPMGLDDRKVASTDEKKVLTGAYYVFGALVTAALLKLMESK